MDAKSSKSSVLDVSNNILKSVIFGRNMNESNPRYNFARFINYSPEEGKGHPHRVNPTNLCRELNQPHRTLNLQFNIL